MATIVTRSGKGSPLTNNEVDANFNNLNTDKLELSGGTLTGSLTAPSLSVDNITIDGTTIALSSGDLTLDVAGDIILDADGGDVYFKDASTTFLQFKNHSTTDIYSLVNNQDLKFIVRDGGNNVEALVFDASEAGAASFNSSVTAPLLITNDIKATGSGGISFQTDEGTKRLEISDAGAATFNSTIATGGGGGSGKIAITGGTATNEQVHITFTNTAGAKVFAIGGGQSGITNNGFVIRNITDGTFPLLISDAGAATFTGAITANAGVVVDNITIDGTTLALSSGDLTLDVAGEINLDADGGRVRFKDGGTDIGFISFANTDLTFYSSVQDRDLIFQGNDGGSAITALTLDMSDAGTATFNAGAKFNGVMEFGFGGAAVQQADSQALTITTPASGGGQGIALKRLDTNADQALGEISWSNNTQDGQANIRVKTAGATNTTDMAFDISNAGTVTQVLNFDGSAGGAATFSSGVTVGGNVDFGDLDMARFGVGNDLQIFHNGTDNFIKNATSNQDLLIQGNDGGNIINALQLDMSQAGRATFNEGIVAKTSTAGDFGLNLNTPAGDSMKLQVVDTGSAGAAHGSISVSDGDLTLDVAGNISLDADGGNILLLDGGARFANISASSTDLVIQSSVQDRDIFLKGNDGGSVITALTLDMSDGGNATFSKDIFLGDNSAARFGTGQDLAIFHDGSNSTIRNTTGNLTLAVTGDIILDASGADVFFGASGNVGSINMASNNVTLSSLVSNKDIIFKGNDDGSTITALTLDMSDGGAAHFTNDIYIKDNQAIRFGDDQDFRIFNDNNHTTFQNSVSNQDLLFKGNDGGSGITALTLDMSAAGAASFNSSITLKDTLSINSASTSGFLQASSNVLQFGTSSNDPVDFYANNTLHMSLKSDGEFIVNETGSAEGDFRVESDSNTHALFVDAGNNRVGVGLSNPSKTFMAGVTQTANTIMEVAKFTGTGSYNSSGSSGAGAGISFGQYAGTYPNWNLGQVSAFRSGAGFSGVLQFATNTGSSETSISPAMSINSKGSVGIGVVDGDVTSDGTAARTYVGIIGTGNRGRLNLGSTAANGADAGTLAFTNGANTLADITVDTASGAQTTGTMFISSTGNLDIRAAANYGVIFNENSVDADFRVESNGNTHALFVDGGTDKVGIGHAPSYKLDIRNDVAASTDLDPVAVRLYNNGDGGSAILFENAVSAKSKISFGVEGTGASTDETYIAFETGANTSMSERFRIASDGSLSTPTAGTSNVRFGVNAGNSIVSGGDRNVLIGDEAGTAITTGDDNVAIGYAALDKEDAHGRNVAIGSYALTNLDAGTLGYNVAIGYECGTAMNTGIQNIAIGAFAGDALTSGTRSVVMGYNAGGGITTGNSNVAIGYQALMTEDEHSNNVAVGASALQSQNAGAHAFNTAVGFDAGKSVSTGVQNTLIGGLAGDALQDADNNVALGYLALTRDTLGSKSTAVGFNTLADQNFTSATDSFNTAMGYNAGGAITTGVQNTFIGGLAGDATDDGTNNVAVGFEALSANCGSGNVALGTRAGKITTADNNTFVGLNAGTATTSGANNTFVGGLAGDTVTTGSNNILIGYAVDAVTTQENSITIGIGISGGNNDFAFGKASNVVFNDFDTDAAWTRSSDQRLKKNIVDSTLGLSFINALRPVKYNWKPSYELDSTDSELAHIYREDEADNEMNTTVTMHNFIAQEVKAALDTAGVSDFGGWKEDKYGVQQVSREMFVIPLVKAIQELSAQVDALTARIETLEG